MHIGGPKVTHCHANIFVNRVGATAAEVFAPITRVQQTLEEETDYHLDTEIDFIGEFASTSDAEPQFMSKPEGFATAAERAKMAAE